MELIRKEDLAENFLEFRPYLDQCRFVGCSHTKEKGCAILEAVAKGRIASSRHQSYLRLYEQAKEIKDWQR
jgi:ribosome biogenesis GTPase